MMFNHTYKGGIPNLNLNLFSYDENYYPTLV